MYFNVLCICIPVETTKLTIPTHPLYIVIVFPSFLQILPLLHLWISLNISFFLTKRKKKKKNSRTLPFASEGKLGFDIAKVISCVVVAISSPVLDNRSHWSPPKIFSCTYIALLWKDLSCFGVWATYGSKHHFMHTCCKTVNAHWIIWFVV